MDICLYEPEIAQNAGTIARLCACMGGNLHIIEPASFVISDSKFKRAGMDYISKANLTLHDSFYDFKNKYNGRIILLDTKATTIYHDFQFQNTDCIMVGRESSGVPEDVFQMCDEKVIIPMNPGVRSLNVAISVAIVFSEALRQLR